MSEFIKPLFGALVRHGLTSLGAVLVALGISSQHVDAWTMASEPIIYGLLIHLGGLVWSAAKNIKTSGGGSSL